MAQTPEANDARAALTRRGFLRGAAAGGVGVLTWSIAGREVLATPAEARAADHLARRWRSIVA